MLLGELLMDIFSWLLIVFKQYRQFLSLFKLVFWRLLSECINMRIENIAILRYQLVPMLGYWWTILDCPLTYHKNWLLSLLVHIVLLLVLVFLPFTWDFCLTRWFMVFSTWVSWSLLLVSLVGLHPTMEFRLYSIFKVSMRWSTPWPFM